MNCTSMTGSGSMTTFTHFKIGMATCWTMSILLLLIAASPFVEIAGATPGEAMYNRLSAAANGTANLSFLENLNVASRNLGWATASETEFVGNLRRIRGKNKNDSKEGSSIYLVRKLTGELLILSVPENMAQLGSSSPYFNLDGAFESKNLFKLRTMEGTHAGDT